MFEVPWGKIISHSLRTFSKILLHSAPITPCEGNFGNTFKGPCRIWSFPFFFCSVSFNVKLLWEWLAKARWGRVSIKLFFFPSSPFFKGWRIQRGQNNSLSFPVVKMAEVLQRSFQQRTSARGPYIPFSFIYLFRFSVKIIQPTAARIVIKFHTVPLRRETLI